MARVLIIDDDPIVSLTLARMLEHEGHTPDLADSGQAALERASAMAPDAIILDMRMPGMSGLEFLRLLRADTRFARLPVGVITGDYFISDQILTELSALGARIRYKPVWLADLTSLTRELLATGTT